jgi:hypothetical protein
VRRSLEVVSFVLVAAAALGCSAPAAGDGRAAGTASAASAAEAASSASPSADESAARAQASGDPDLARDDDTAREIEPIEAPARERATPSSAREAERVAKFAPAAEPSLEPHLATIREHFGEVDGLELQKIVRFGTDRAFVLLSSRGRATTVAPLLLAVDARAASPGTSSIAWSRDRPLAGTFPGATELALAGAPDDGVTLAWFDPTTRSVALRKWRADGVVEADFVLGQVDACDAVSALFWPKHGWLVVASDLGRARAFLLGLGGTLAWPREGADVSLGRLARAPVALAPVADDALLVVGVGTARSGARKAPEHAVALRLDATGAAPWDTPADLGPAPAREDRLVAVPDSRGVRVTLGPRRAVFVDAQGAVRPAR